MGWSQLFQLPWMHVILLKACQRSSSIFLLMPSTSTIYICLTFLVSELKLFLLEQDKMPIMLAYVNSWILVAVKNGVNGRTSRGLKSLAYGVFNKSEHNFKKLIKFLNQNSFWCTIIKWIFKIYFKDYTKNNNF